MIRAIASVASCLAIAAQAQQFEARPYPRDEPRAKGYLDQPAKVDYRAVLGKPPAAGSPEARKDRSTVESLQEGDLARFTSAAQDSRFLLPRFSEAFGLDLDREELPQTVNLLRRAIRDVAITAFEAKDAFLRTRPYQDIQLKRACGFDKPPAPEREPKERSSYPSGHSAYGWGVAMVLSRVRPERGEALSARAREYAESRLVCGMHYPADVEAGRRVAVAVVKKLETDPGFLADLEKARAEIAKRTRP